MGSDLACLPSFANVAEGDREVLALMTYRQLVETLGQGRVSPETFRKMAESGKLFDLPEQEGVDLLNLAKRLKEFEQMLASGNVDLEVTNELIRAELNRMALATVRADLRLKDSIAATASIDVSIPFTKGSIAPAYSPDGNWPIALSPNEVEIYDFKSKTLRKEPRQQDPSGSVQFMPDGKTVLFSIGYSAMLSRNSHRTAHFLVPFENGIHPPMIMTFESTRVRVAASTR